MNKKEDRYIALCHRCEHRAKWYETGGKYRPRFECGADETKDGIPLAKYACYMYHPVKPIVLSPINGETRPLSPNFSHFSGRSKGLRIADGKIDIREYEDGIVWFWLPDVSTQ